MLPSCWTTNRTYASTIWDPFTQENQNEIEMVQRRAARFACNNCRREASVTTMRDELGWRSLKQRRADQRLIMLYKIVNNLVEVDLSKELIPLTRHLEIVTPNPLKFPKKRKPIFNTAFLPRIIKQWNILPATLATVPSLNVFKSGVC